MGVGVAVTGGGRDGVAVTTITLRSPQAVSARYRRTKSRMIAPVELTSPPVPLSQKAGEGEPVDNCDLAPFSPHIRGGKGLGDRGVALLATVAYCRFATIRSG